MSGRLSDEQWVSIFTLWRDYPQQRDIPGFSRENQLCERTVRRWFDYWQEDPSKTPNTIHRGGHNRVFDHSTEERVLHSLIGELGSEGIPIPNSFIQDSFKAIYQEEHPRETRAFHFSASNGWLQRLKNEHQISARKSTKSRKNPPDWADVQHYDEILADLTNRYHPSHIVNSDETNIRVSGMTCFTNQYIGERTYSSHGYGNPKGGVTAIGTVSAMGDKLPLTIVAVGTTDRCELNLDVPDGIWTDRSENGWVDENVALSHLYNLASFFEHDPIALIWDSWDAHWTQEVQRIAGELQIELIKVPENATDIRQPLDISVYGTVKEQHKEWLRERSGLEQRPMEIRRQSVAHFCHLFNTVDPKIIRRGFREAGLKYQSPWNSTPQ